MAQALIGMVGSPGNRTPVTCPLFDPEYVRRHRRRFRRDAPPELDFANSLYVPAGRWPARGWVLVKRGDYNNITSLYGTDFQLQINDFINGQLTFKNLAVVQARCVSRGLASDPSAIYLVELTDLQGVIWNPWAQLPMSMQYNVRAPAYPETFYTSSLNAGAPWSWDGMVGDIWTNQIGTTFLGPYPHLPISPTGIPENFIFPGVAAWSALNQVLDYLGLTQSEDLTQASPYGIVVPGAADAAFSSKQTKYANLLEEDYEWIDAGAGRIPGQVTVYFHRRNQYYGTEETVRGDSLQWQSTPLYQIPVAAPAQFAAAPGQHGIWADYTVRFDVNNLPLVADASAAQAIANERASQYYTRAYRGTLGYLRQVYAGALPFAAGSQVDGVAWYMDYRRGHFGWCTELIRGPQPPWTLVQVEGQAYSGD